MKAGSAGTYLHLVCIEPDEKSEAALTREIPATDWTDPFSTRGDQEVREHGIHSEQWWSDERSARVQMLRARVQAGTYRVDSVALAERLLDTTVSQNGSQ
ncbi:MAG TPA: flagellar biosynthesis anti-sigma factor FlgM [Ktedonobacteraceae bacterium]|nr:flagellar biosynthesis anti-sigma factor FlgM [Ktedonobacteraceae bacterium]